MFRSIAGRVRQVAFYLVGRADAGDERWAEALLNPAQRELFQALARPDRAHALRVARRLEARGAPAYVLEAALLHDAGKPADFGLPGRVLGVLLAGRAATLPAAPPLAGLDRQLQIYRWHEAWGLAAAERAGTSLAALALLRAALGEPGEDAWLAALEAADDAG